MKKTLIFCFLLFGLFSGRSYAQEKLTNQSIIDMVELGFGADIIKSKINSSDVDFDTDMEALKLLKANGVSSDLIALMIDKSSHKTQTKTGIYYMSGGEKIRITPNVFSGTRTNAIAYAFSYGIANAKSKSYLSGAYAQHKISSIEDMVFIFQFDENNAGDISSTNWWFRTATSPQEFVLVRMKQNTKKGLREIITGKFGLASGGSQVGTESKDSAPFKYEEIGNGAYRVIPNPRLIPGEYCFYYKGTVPVGGLSNQSVFDFSVR